MPTRMLVADDEPLQRLALREILMRIAPSIFGSAEDVIMIEAGNGREALAEAEKHNLDLMLLDIRLPSINGISVCHRVKSVSNAKVIIITAYSSYVDDARAAGADRILFKPVDQATLADTIQQVLGVTRADAGWPLESSEHPEIDRVIAYMKAHLDRPITLAEMAKEVHLSVSHFARLFKKVVDKTPNDYLVELRLLQARRQLAATKGTIRVIAQDCGFRSHSYFTQLFRRHTGLSPSEWRRRLS